MLSSYNGKNLPTAPVVEQQYSLSLKLITAVDHSMVESSRSCSLTSPLQKQNRIATHRPCNKMSVSIQSTFSRQKWIKGGRKRNVSSHIILSLVRKAGRRKVIWWRYPIKYRWKCFSPCPICKVFAFPIKTRSRPKIKSFPLSGFNSFQSVS